MRGAGAAALIAALAFVAAPVAAQNEDWDLTLRPDARLTAATVDFGDNLIAVRCRAGALDVLVTGIPPVSSEAREVTVSIGAIAAETQKWVATPGSPVLSANDPDRLARQLRSGGDFTLRLSASSVETPPLPARTYRLTVPTSASAIDQVLAACGESLADDRDAIPRLLQAVSWLRRPVVEFPESGISSRAASVRISCIVGENGRPEACRTTSANPAGKGFEEAALQATRDARLDLPTGIDAIGRVAAFNILFRLE